MANLSNQLARQESEDVAKGVRRMLASPLLLADSDPEMFKLICLRRVPLQRWFEYYCGWRLIIEPRQGHVRLVKVGGGRDASRPAKRHRTSRAPFDRRRYTLYCLLAAELAAVPMTTIGMLADRIVQATAAEAGISTFATERRDERAAFVDALKLLERQGVVDPTDGSTETYLEHEDAKVLFTVNSSRLLALLAAPVSPSRMADELAEGEPNIDEILQLLSAEPRYGDASDPVAEVSETQRNLWFRHSFMRRLFDEPVVYKSDLTEEQLSYLTSLTGKLMLRRAAEQAGFVLEERAEGYLLVDPDGIATDERFPDDRNTAKTAALLLLDHLVAMGSWLRWDQIVDHAERLLAKAPAWAKGYQSDGGATRLAEDGLRVLTAFQLAVREQDQVRALPAAARYTVERIRGDENA